MGLNIEHSHQRRAALAEQHIQIVTGYGPVRRLFSMGALAGILVGLTPVAVVLVNAFFRLIAARHRPFQQFQNPSASSVITVIPDLLILGLFGGVLALCRMVSVRRNWFWLISSHRGLLRLGLDDLFGLVAGIPLLWLILNRHSLGGLLLFTGLMLPVLGLAFTWIWEPIYKRLAARFITVPPDVALGVIVQQTLTDARETSELFRVEKITVELTEKRLVIQGAASKLFHTGKNEQRLRDVVRMIPAVTQNIKEIRIVDTARQE